MGDDDAECGKGTIKASGMSSGDGVAIDTLSKLIVVVLPPLFCLRGIFFERRRMVAVKWIEVSDDGSLV
jgi:hypothetical protein